MADLLLPDASQDIKDAIRAEILSAVPAPSNDVTKPDDGPKPPESDPATTASPIPA